MHRLLAHRPGGGVRAGRPGRGDRHRPVARSARRAVGLRGGTGAGGGLPRRREPDPVRAPRAPSAPPPAAFADRARRAGPALLDRSSARPHAVGAALGAAGAPLGSGPRPPSAPAAAWPPRPSPLFVAGRPCVRGAGSTWPSGTCSTPACVAMFTEEVEVRRRWGQRQRCRVPGEGPRPRAGRPGVRSDRGRPGCCSRPSWAR